jgi:hypothetical protein
MLKSPLLLFFFTISFSSFAQRIIENSFLWYIDDSYQSIDTIASKNHINTVNCYRWSKNADGPDSVTLTSQKKFDSEGHVIELIQGDNLTNKQIDYMVSWKKLSDTTIESIALFPPVSKMISPYYFIDTVIKGASKRIGLFKEDKSKNIYMRSVCTAGSGFLWKEIKRYDLNNKLVEICYPQGNLKPREIVTNISVHEYDSVVTDSYIYDDYINKSKSIYSRKGTLKTIWNMTLWPGRSDSTLYGTMYYYDTEDRLVLKGNVDINNQITAEERFYYNGRKLTRYTRDEDFNDSLFAEQRVYNSAGQIVYSNSYNRFNGQNFIYKYLYDERGLLTRMEHYTNDELKYYERYEYK